MEKIALVTGASRGIGRAIAANLARSGWSVCINYKERRDCAQSLLDELTAEGCRRMIFQADIRDRTQVDAMAEAVRGRFGEISLLVNNAGISRQGLFQDMDSETWRDIFAVNVDGAYHACQAVLPAMIREHTGCIVNISSMWGLRGASCEVAYACTKAAIIGLTRSLAMELAPSGIRVNAVAPGVIRTDMLKEVGLEILPQLEEETPLGRLGTPEDIAHAVAFFADERSSFITGQVLSSDGGYIV